MRKIKTKHGKIFTFVMWIARLFKKAPTIHNLNNEKGFEQGIIVSNHSAASGPLTLSLYYPGFFVPWGTYEMTGRYFQRWKYLYHVFYQQKLGYGKIKSYILATLFGIISKMLYKGMQLIPTYPNANVRKTIDISISHLEKGNSILIFPEDSNTGYHEHLIKYNNGFIYLCERYFSQKGIDLPIYPVYYHKILGSLVIGEKIHVQDLVKQGLSREEIAEYFKNLTNQLAEKLFALERLNPAFNEEKVFKTRLLTKLANISGKYIDLSLSDFIFLNLGEAMHLYEQVMKDVMKKRDRILNDDNSGELKIRYYRR